MQQQDGLAPFERFMTQLDALQARLQEVANVVLPTGAVVTRAEATALGFTTENTVEVKPQRWF
ncbi:MAG: hypothetical protein RI947_1207 [Candidatus Parcubacteria bacterium]|jgi:hypothetical protein